MVLKASVLYMHLMWLIAQENVTELIGLAYVWQVLCMNT